MQNLIAHGNDKIMMERKTVFTFEIDPALDNSDENLSPILTYESEYEDGTERVLKVRLDKWLWAARFFKTRALARAAIESGKIFYDGQKVIPSKEIELNSKLAIHQGRVKKMVIIRGLSTRRRSSEEADGLYEEVTAIYSEPNDHENDDLHSNELNEQPRDSRPRKMVRFLRRGIGVSDSSFTNREYEYTEPAE